MKKASEEILAKQRAGHRDRIRERFIENGISALQTYEVLEYLLFLLIPRRDVKPIAKSLLESFDGLTGVLSASIQKLVEFGLTKRISTDLHFLHEMMCCLHLEKLKERPTLSDAKEVVDYLQAKLGHSTKETLVIFYLDSGRKLLGVWEQCGTVNNAAVAPREIAERALLLHAAGVVLAHNHPSGNCKPSQSDVDFTRTIYNALDLLNIQLLDHIIVTRDQYKSLMS